MCFFCFFFFYSNWQQAKHVYHSHCHRLSAPSWALWPNERRKSAFFIPAWRRRSQPYASVRSRSIWQPKWGAWTRGGNEMGWHQSPVTPTVNETAKDSLFCAMEMKCLSPFVPYSNPGLITFHVHHERSRRGSMLNQLRRRTSSTFRLIQKVEPHNQVGWFRPQFRHTLP